MLSWAHLFPRLSGEGITQAAPAHHDLEGPPLLPALGPFPQDLQLQDTEGQAAPIRPRDPWEGARESRRPPSREDPQLSLSVWPAPPEPPRRVSLPGKLGAGSLHSGVPASNGLGVAPF